VNAYGFASAIAEPCMRYMPGICGAEIAEAAGVCGQTFRLPLDERLELTGCRTHRNTTRGLRWLIGASTRTTSSGTFTAVAALRFANAGYTVL
jgi:hypothetical protein